MPGHVRCAICEESLGREDTNEFLRQAELGNIAEMFNPQNPDEGGIVHTECGLARDWEVS
jgi:hypothetical protein